MATASWRVNGQYYETCSCDFVCPCISGQMAVRPSKGSCTFAMGFEIERGSYGTVALDGLGFIVLGLTPEAMGNRPRSASSAAARVGPLRRLLSSTWPHRLPWASTLTRPNRFISTTQDIRPPIASRWPTRHEATSTHSACRGTTRREPTTASTRLSRGRAPDSLARHRDPERSRSSGRRRLYDRSSSPRAMSDS